MNGKRVIYEGAGGVVAVLIPAPGCGLTVEEIAAKDVPQGVPFEVVEAAQLPTDRLFRAAWRKVGAVVFEDVTAARLVAHDKRRQARAAEFAPLDIEATIPAKAAAAEAARQVIRDRHAQLQADIDAAATPDALRALLAPLVV